MSQKWKRDKFLWRVWTDGSWTISPYLKIKMSQPRSNMSFSVGVGWGGAQRSTESTSGQKWNRGRRKKQISGCHLLCLPLSVLGSWMFITFISLAGRRCRGTDKCNSSILYQCGGCVGGWSWNCPQAAHTVPSLVIISFIFKPSSLWLPGFTFHFCHKLCSWCILGWAGLSLRCSCLTCTPRLLTSLPAFLVSSNYLSEWRLPLRLSGGGMTDRSLKVYHCFN